MRVRGVWLIVAIGGGAAIAAAVVAWLASSGSWREARAIPRERWGETLGFPLPASARDVRAVSRAAGLRDGRIQGSFRMARDDLPALAGRLPCALDGRSRSCAWGCGHERTTLRFDEEGGGLTVRVEKVVVDNNAFGPCPR